LSQFQSIITEFCWKRSFTSFFKASSS